MVQRDILGRCPECFTVVHRSTVLIEYEREGQEAVFAECPSCRNVISPGVIRVPSLDPE